MDPMRIAPERQRRLTVSEYHRMIEAGVLGEDEHVELLQGVLVETTPQGGAHGSLVQWLTGLLVRGVGERFAVRVQLPLTLSEDSEPEPDFAVVPEEPRTWTGHPTHALLVIEVSVSSVRIDRHVKSGIYARAGIPEYWLINFDERCVEVYRDPDATSGRYRTLQTMLPGDRLRPSELPGPELVVGQLFPPT